MLTDMSDLSVQAQATPMSLSDKIAIVAVIVAVIAIPVTVWATRRYGNRRGVVLFTHESTQLIPDLPFSTKDLLKVEYRGIPVPDPHLLNLRLQNIGPRDVSSSDFDARRSVTIKTNCKFYGFVSLSHPKQTVSPAIGSDGMIEIKPMLLKTTEAWEATAIISGEPTIGPPDAPLVNVNVIDRKAFEATVASSFLVGILRGISAALPGAGAAIAVTDVISSRLGDK